MRSIIKILPLLLILMLTSCGTEEVPEINDCTWKMETVAISANGTILYYNPQTELSYVYPNTEPLQLICDADDGAIAISDKTNEKTYTGTYQLTDSNIDVKQYKVCFGDVEGYVITGNTEYLNEDPRKTLIITVSDYTMYFYEIE